MIVVFRNEAEPEQIERVVQKIEACGLRVHISQGTTRTIVGCIGDETALAAAGLRAMPGVEGVIPIQRQYKLASREFVARPSRVALDGAEFGADAIVVIAGPCSVENPAMLRETAVEIGRHGARVLRGGAFKPRTSPYSFRGLGTAALEMLTSVREETGLPVVTEVMDPRQVEPVGAVADMLQIGARNMQNFDLLDEVGQLGHPVLLKRGMSARIEELLLAAEYVLKGGNMQVVLCERGIRTFETLTRNTLDLSAVAVLKRETHLPVIVDPSHAAGRRDIIPDLAVAAIAAGADGLMIEVHPRPEQSVSDGEQALGFADFERLMERVAAVSLAVNRVAPGQDGLEPERAN